MAIQLLWFVISAVLEITGCWMMLQAFSATEKMWAWLCGSVIVLLAFAVVISHADLGLSGKTYAAYGGIYIASAFVWYIVVDKGTPSIWDIAGVVLAVGGTLVILTGHFLGLNR